MVAPTLNCLISAPHSDGPIGHRRVGLALGDELGRQRWLRVAALARGEQ
jgi:hypothetical protein